MTLRARPIRFGCRGLLFAAFLIATACSAEQPLSPGEEASLGHAEYPRMLTLYGGAYSDAKISGWLNGVGRNLVDHCGHADIPFTFTVLNTGGINAFSTPGGFIYVTRGLLAQANSEAEVAAALGHEMGHVIAHHQAARYKNSERGGIGLAFLGIFGGSPELSGLLDLDSDERAIRFSQDQEFEADNLGIGIIAAAGYDPAFMARFLRSVEADAAFRDRLLGAAAGHLHSNFLDTHPVTADRVARAETEAGAFKSTDAIKGDRNAYLRIIDGLAYGDGPSQGYIRGRRFVHVQAGFSFEAPPGFVLQNSPSAVVGLRADGAGLILTSAIPSTVASPLDYLTRIWAKGVPLSNAEPTIVNRHSAAIAALHTTSDQVPVDISLTAIGWSPGLVYRLIFIAPQSAASDLGAEIKASINSFHALTPTEAAGVRQWRLHIAVAKTGDTVGKVARRMAPDDFREDRFRFLNGMKPAEELRPGQSFKLVE